MSLPLIGNLHQFGTEPHKTFMKMSETYGRIFAIDFATFRGVVLNDYKLIKQCFAEHAFSGRPKLNSLIERCGGKARGMLRAQEFRFKLLSYIVDKSNPYPNLLIQESSLRMSMLKSDDSYLRIFETLDTER
jgi:hypothetical protein